MAEPVEAVSPVDVMAVSSLVSDDDLLPTLHLPHKRARYAPSKGKGVSVATAMGTTMAMSPSGENEDSATYG